MKLDLRIECEPRRFSDDLGRPRQHGRRDVEKGGSVEC